MKIQPNVVIGGGWAHHNMHLHGGIANGGLVEYYYAAVKVCKTIYGALPAPQDGWLALPDRPGLGFEPVPERVEELRRNPTSHGRGKA